MKHGTRQITGFALKLALFYGLFAAPWPGLRETYATFFRGGGNLLFRSFGSRGAVRFLPEDSKNRKWDTELHLMHRGRPTFWRIYYSSRVTGYLPTSVLFALVLATPIPWKRRWRALWWGGVLVNGFVIFRVAISIVHWFPSVDLYVLSPFWSRVLKLIYQTVSLSTVTSYLAAVLIWILVTLRRNDWLPMSGDRTSAA